MTKERFIRAFASSIYVFGRVIYAGKHRLYANIQTRPRLVRIRHVIMSPSCLIHPNTTSAKEVGRPTFQPPPEKLADPVHPQRFRPFAAAASKKYRGTRNRIYPGRQTRVRVTLLSLGFDDFFARQLGALEAGQIVGRVVAEEKVTYRVRVAADDAPPGSADGEFWADLAGKFRHSASDRTTVPAVGDFVVLRNPVRDFKFREFMAIERIM